ncbi:unnamed protein product [Calypogeia fissa]
MSYFLCCAIRRPSWQRNLGIKPKDIIVKANIPIKKLAIVALRLSPNNGGCAQGTGILIHNSLVLTSYMSLPNKKSAEDGEIVLNDAYLEANQFGTSPGLNDCPPRILTRKLLPTRFKQN